MHNAEHEFSVRQKHPSLKQKPVHMADNVMPGRKGAVIVKDIVEQKSGR